jgi:urease accessory protein UreE
MAGDVLLVTAADQPVPPGTLDGKERDALVVRWEERRWGRRRAVTRAGRQVALALPTGSLLRPGAVLLVGSDWYLAVEAAPEPVIAAFPRDRREAVRVAFEVGNRHFALAQGPAPDDALLVRSRGASRPATSSRSSPTTSTRRRTHSS